MGETVLRPKIIGIAGGSGSGKTTVTAALMTVLGARGALLQHDWYYCDQAARPESERALLNFDHPDALETALLVSHLNALRAGQAIEAPQYDFTTHTRAQAVVRVIAVPYVVVEGINALAEPNLCDMFDLKVFVDTPADIRFIRRLQRDVAERGRTVESVIAQYLGQVRPMHQAYVESCLAEADLVLSGEAAVEDSVARVLACLGIDTSP